MGPRILTLGHMAKAVAKSDNNKAGDPDDGLQPNQMHLYSYYKPGLTAGTYTIEAKQTVTLTADPEVGTTSLDIWNTSIDDPSNTLVPQTFNVVVPRFTLDPAIINSYYPPDGHQDEGRILPHIVLNDPHYPWEVVTGATDTNMFEPVDEQTFTLPDGTTEKISRGLVPWIALLVFDPEDLKLGTPEDMAALVPSDIKADFNKQDPKGVFRMSVSEYFKITPSSRMNFEAGFDTFSDIASTEGNVDVIFPTKSQFKTIFQNDADTSTHKVGVEAFKYLSHVRHIRTDGFPDAGVEEDGFYSIVISSRIGAYDITTPKTQICHLVSIENVDSTLVGDWLKTPVGGVDRVGMISLFSWIYTALPPNPVNFVDTVRNLTENQQMLTVDQKVLQAIDKAAKSGVPKPPAMDATISRMQAGYTLARWRTQTGEETVALNRGPLVPQPVAWPGTQPSNSTDVPLLHDIVDSSNTSQDFQILDSQTGIMDISYSSAWQIGKMLAISDTVFSAALMRFRSLVHNNATQLTLMDLNGVRPRSQVLASAARRIAEIKNLSISSTVEPQRVLPMGPRAPIVDVQAPANLPKFVDHVGKVVGVQTSSGDDQALYNEFNKAGANNSDWAIIHTWLCDKLLLGGIPNHYIFPETAYIPSESLRFFYIDDFWLDCLLDGALSVANHLDVDDDGIRRSIKEWFNLYLRTVVPNDGQVPNAGHVPQIPGYGFVIRSKVIQAMPDLRITVTWNDAPGVTDTNPDLRAPVCRWTKIDDETLMCLLDRQPEELKSVVLAQPPHQQRFALGSHIDATGVTFHLRHLYTLNPPDGEWPEKNLDKSKYDPNSWYFPQTRMLNIQHMASQLNGALQFQDPGGSGSPPSPSRAYQDLQSNSCEFGLELNDPSYYFKITPVTQGTASPRVRQLYVRPPRQSDFSEPATANNQAHSLSPAVTGRKPPQPSAVSTQPPAGTHLPAVQQPEAPVHPTAATQAPVAHSTSRSPVAPTAVQTLGPKGTAIQSPLPVPRGPSKPVRIQLTNPSRQALPTAHPSELTHSRTSVDANFDIYVYPDHHDPPIRFPVAHGFRKFHKDDFIPTGNMYLFDLIFGIRKRDSVDVQILNPDGTVKHAGTTSKLLKIEVDIPMQTPSTLFPGGPTRLSKAPITGPQNMEPLLTDNYDGPGVHMLSNQRFVPFLFYHESPTIGWALHVELIPRSTALLDANGNSNFVIRINDSRTDELSFRLAEANICATQTKVEEMIEGIPDDADHNRGECTIVMTEWYSTPARPEGEAVQTRYTVLKNDIRDD